MNILDFKEIIIFLNEYFKKMNMRQLQMFQKVEYGGRPILKVVLKCLKCVLNLFLSISIAYNVISCQKVAENTQILKIAKFAM